MLNSPVDGSIGVMAVKKNEDGIGLFFAHSTDSFVCCSHGIEMVFAVFCLLTG